MSNALRDKSRIAILGADGKISGGIILPSITQAKRYVRTKQLSCRIEPGFKFPAAVHPQQLNCPKFSSVSPQEAGHAAK